MRGRLVRGSRQVPWSRPMRAPFADRRRRPVSWAVSPRVLGERGLVAVSQRLLAERGQVTLLLVGGLLAVLAGGLILGAVARGLGTRDAAQRAADLAAVGGARAMHDSFERLFEPPIVDGRPNPRHLPKADYLALGRAAAMGVAAANGAPHATVTFPDARTLAPVRVRVAVERRLELGGAGGVPMRADAEAELAPPAGAGPAAFASGGGYDGPLAYRQGKPMRPDVAQAFDRMAAAARRGGVHLVISSGFRSDAEQAVLFARHPDPKWVAPPGESLHRNATELDLGPALGVRLAGCPRGALPLRPALRVGAVALRVSIGL